MVEEVGTFSLYGTTLTEKSNKISGALFRKETDAPKNIRHISLMAKDSSMMKILRSIEANSHILANINQTSGSRSYRDGLL